jgi:hypothetical protein
VSSSPTHSFSLDEFYEIQCVVCNVYARDDINPGILGKVFDISWNVTAPVGQSLQVVAQGEGGPYVDQDLKKFYSQWPHGRLTGLFDGFRIEALEELNRIVQSSLSKES